MSQFAHADSLKGLIAKLLTPTTKFSVKSQHTIIEDFYKALSKTTDDLNEAMRASRTSKKYQGWNNGAVRARRSILRSKLSDGSIVDVSVVRVLQRGPRGNVLGQRVGLSVVTNTKSENIFDDLISTVANGSMRETKYFPPDAAIEDINTFRVVNVQLPNDPASMVGVVGRLELLVKKMKLNRLGNEDIQTSTRSVFRLEEAR